MAKDKTKKNRVKCRAFEDKYSAMIEATITAYKNKGTAEVGSMFRALEDIKLQMADEILERGLKF